MENTRPLTAILAIGMDGTIGIDNKIPWNCPEDLRHFQNITEWHPIIMGRKTYESIGKPLPKRFNLVISSQQPTKKLPGSVWFSSVQPVFDYLKTYSGEVFVIGGTQIFNLFSPWINKMIVTKINYQAPFHVEEKRITKFILPANQYTWNNSDGPRWHLSPFYPAPIVENALFELWRKLG